MPEKNHILPEGMFDSSSYGYTQVVTSSPGTLICISGQVAWDEEGNVVGDDVATQAKQALDNLAKALDAAGATPAQTILGVQSLAMHDLLIEIEAMAVV